MADSEKKPIELKLFRATPKEMIHCGAVLRGQLARVMYDYVIPDGGGPSVPISRKPPALDHIPLHESHIFLLALMDAPDNSAEGVSQVLEEVASQVGMTVEELLKHLQVVEGDLRTFQNFESLRKKRYPAGSSIGALDNLVTIPGVSHNMWNVAL